jgi:hypothetical protein
MRGVNLAGFLIALAAVPLAAQSGLVQAGLDQGHRLGTSVAYLKESGDLRDGPPISITLPNSAGQPGKVMILIRPSNGSGTVQAATLSVGTIFAATTLAPSIEPCAAFEAWAETRTSNFMDSTQTGATVMERTPGKAVFERFVRDDLRQIDASYTVTVETLPEEGTYRVSFGPPPDGHAFNKPDWKVYSPAKYPAPQIMKAEDSIRLELYTIGSPGNTTRRVVDYIHVGRQDKMVMLKETPHDAYADDAELAVTQPRFRVNGAAGGTVAPLPETILGPVVWVYVPGHGKYVLSLQPHQDLRFESAGEVEGNSLMFTAPDGNVFRIDTAERIAAGSGSYSVHVLSDQSWTPADPQDRERILIGAAPGVEGAAGR